MPRSAAATPAAQIRSIVKFFETADLAVAQIAFELARAGLAGRTRKTRVRRTAAPVVATRLVVTGGDIPAYRDDPTPTVTPTPDAPPPATAATAAPGKRMRGSRQPLRRQATKRKTRTGKRKQPSAVPGLPPQQTGGDEAREDLPFSDDDEITW